MVVIKTQNLTKNFGDVVAVDDVSLEIEEGECFGLLGPNGAGKTSLIRMITAVSPSTNGEIWVLDSDLQSHSRQVKAVLGVVPQVDNLDPDLTVLQNLLTFARYFDIPKVEAHRRSMEVLRLFQLEDRCKSRIRELSGGMRRRLLVARGLINSPRVMVLDEPTIGLDPQAKYLVWHKLTELKSQGVTQLLCTQNMEEASALCDRVAIMHQGRIMSLDAPAKLISRYVGEVVWEIELNSEERDKTINGLESHGLDFEVVGDKIHIFHVKDDELTSGVLDWRKAMRRAATLEDVFFRLTGRSLAE
ncbi:MAG: ABC transporter ATP-binding protein [Chloroflexi bacterium]|nr:ABC transporter ATP-binding protein [Chloroflexota bacterium]MBL7061582.1 ABC transporter ATP-binding protein [Dehalococcoidia bacterium]